MSFSLSSSFTYLFIFSSRFIILKMFEHCFFLFFSFWFSATKRFLSAVMTSLIFAILSVILFYYSWGFSFFFFWGGDFFLFWFLAFFVIFCSVSSPVQSRYSEPEAYFLLNGSIGWFIGCYAKRTEQRSELMELRRMHVTRSRTGVTLM